MLTEATSVDYSHKSSITSKHVTRAALPAAIDPFPIRHRITCGLRG